MKTKTTFTYSRQDIIVTQWRWGTIKDNKNKTEKDGWVRKGPSLYYSLKSIKWATVSALLDQFDCHSGESVDDLMRVFTSIDERIGRIADAIENNQGGTIIDQGENT